MVKSVIILPLFFYMVIAGLIAVTGLTIIGRAWMSVRRKRGLNPSHSAEARDTTIRGGSSDLHELGTLTRRPLLTATETTFYRALQDAVGTRYIIFTQLPLWTMIHTAIDDNRLATIVQNRISLKRVDFVLVDPVTLEPQAILELDDRSHRREDHVKRDIFVASVLEQVGIPLVRIPIASTYASPKIRQLLGIDVPQTRLA
jgi:very-short-patch-repair endonuclease